MRLVICLPDSEGRDFCRRRINELAKIDSITLTVDEVNPSEAGEGYFNLADFADMDIVYIGVDRDCDGIRIAKSIRKAGINAVIDAI